MHLTHVAWKSLPWFSVLGWDEARPCSNADDKHHHPGLMPQAQLGLCEQWTCGKGQWTRGKGHPYYQESNSKISQHSFDIAAWRRMLAVVFLISNLLAMWQNKNKLASGPNTGNTTDSCASLSILCSDLLTLPLIPCLHLRNLQSFYEATLNKRVHYIPKF